MDADWLQLGSATIWGQVLGTAEKSLLQIKKQESDYDQIPALFDVYLFSNQSLTSSESASGSESESAFGLVYR